MPPTRDQLRLMREYAEAGNAEAQVKLGMCCYAGEGIPQNYREAARLFRLAADQGFADAQSLLALCYMEGTGVLEDMGEGLRLLTLAAEQGHTGCWLILARMNRAAGMPSAAVPREAARLIAQGAQWAEDPSTREAIIAQLSNSADDRNIARTCCIGCGKTEQLQVCAKCLTAKFCSRECQVRMWHAHKPVCRAWAEQKAAAATEAGGASSSALTGPGEEGGDEAEAAAEEQA
jgi:hypothetical protein